LASAIAAQNAAVDSRLRGSGDFAVRLDAFTPSSQNTAQEAFMRLTEQKRLASRITTAYGVLTQIVRVARIGQIAKPLPPALRD